MNTVYLDLAVKTFETGEAVAGAVFKNRVTAGENETFYKYEPFKIASLYSEKEASKFSYIVKVILQMIEELPPGTEAVVVRSCASQFTQIRRLIKTFQGAPVNVRTLYYQRLKSIDREAFILCEDAAERKSNIFIEV